MSTTVDALLPLSFLESVRGIDRPDSDEAEFVAELRNKRLGLSATVYAQIRRYTDAVKRHQRTDREEAVALARLIGRRPDAEEVFRAAGRYLARETHKTIPNLTRKMVRTLPSFIARPIALSRIRRIARHYLDGNVSRVGAFVTLRVLSPITLESTPGSVGCTYYEAALRELLSLLAVSGGAVEHVQCAARGGSSCEWRAEWRPVEKRS